MNNPPDKRGVAVDVLIIGAGPVGLALAIELGSRGIKAMIVEQHERVGRQPRAKTTNVRTMEHMRRWGLADKVLAAAPLPTGYGNNVIFATKMFGQHIVEIENAFNARPDRDDLYSQGAQWIPQYSIENILREKVVALPECQLRFQTKFINAAQDRDQVDITLEDIESGATEMVSATYLVGADGAGSAVRDMLGFVMEGERGFSAFLNLVLRIPGLTGTHPHAPAIMYWLTNADSPAVMGPMDSEDVWYWAIQLPDEKMPNDSEIQSLVRQSIGKDVEFEIMLTDPWFANRLMASGYASGRIFLVGDACHLHPPFGGFGMNMGVSDAVDLGWKIAAALDGWGGRHLLDSYETERRHVHRRVIDVAVENTSVLTQHFVQPGLEDATEAGEAARREAAASILEHKLQEFRSLGTVLGSNYSGSPVVVDDGSNPPPDEVVTYTPSAHPGCRAPHCWLADGTSLYDQLSAGFTLLATEAFDPSEIEPLLGAARDASLPLDVIEPADDRLSDLYGAKFTLIRPDQHVAWRGNVIDRGAQSIIDIVRGERAQAENTVEREPARA